MRCDSLETITTRDSNALSKRGINWRVNTGQIQRPKFNLGVGMQLASALHSRFAGSTGATGENYVGAGRSQRPGGFKAYASIGARDYDKFIGQIPACEDLVGGGLSI
jgi:hypothetical protein